MRKILLSIITIVLVVSAGVWGTRAYFSDVENITGNTFSTGTIDISVDKGQVEGSYNLEDMKPSQTDYIDFVVYNNGTNPINLYKTLKTFIGQDLIKTPAETEAEEKLGGARDDVQNAIYYDMTVELYKVDPKTPGAKRIWWESIYLDSDHKVLGTLEDQPMYLGMIPAGWYMKVMQSYHMPIGTGNEYQGDWLKFDISLEAKQLGVDALRLENKEDVDFGNISHTLITDGKYADLFYKVKDRKFDYTLTPHGLVDGEYTLIHYVDPLDGSNPWSLGISKVLDYVTVSGATPFPHNVELGENLTNAKVWLVKGHYGTGTGSTTGVLSWDPANMYMETGLMDYYDADL